MGKQHPSGDEIGTSKNYYIVLGTKDEYGTDRKIVRHNKMKEGDKKEHKSRKQVKVEH
jgi:hypothetical protein